MRESPTKRKEPLQPAAVLSRNKERNCDGESVLCIGKTSLPHLLYILYQIFRHAQIFAEILRAAEIACKLDYMRWHTAAFLPACPANLSRHLFSSHTCSITRVTTTRSRLCRPRCHHFSTVFSYRECGPSTGQYHHIRLVRPKNTILHFSPTQKETNPKALVSFSVKWKIFHYFFCIFFLPFLSKHTTS